MGFRYGAVFAILRAEESTDLPLDEILRSACAGTCRSRAALKLGKIARLGVTKGGLGVYLGAARW
ncbi:MAG: hypothetical protein CMG98_09720 [Marinovum sp.]|nr:hypothetical protein [Marinovum sp.]HCC97715.1 hypothetical protein [Paracoccaceae bacterium]